VRGGFARWAFLLTPARPASLFFQRLAPTGARRKVGVTFPEYPPLKACSNSTLAASGTNAAWRSRRMWSKRWATSLFALARNESQSI
jgi:hypothetical protein